MMQQSQFLLLWFQPILFLSILPTMQLEQIRRVFVLAEIVKKIHAHVVYLGVSQILYLWWPPKQILKAVKGLTNNVTNIQ